MNLHVSAFSSLHLLHLMLINSNLYSVKRKHQVLGFCICLHIQDNFIDPVNEVGHIFETEVCALCGMLWAGNLGQTVEKIHASQEAEAEGTGCQQLTIGKTRLQQGLLAFLLPMAVAQVRFPIYLQEQTENLVLISGYISAKKQKQQLLGSVQNPMASTFLLFIIIKAQLITYENNLKGTCKRFKENNS